MGQGIKQNKGVKAKKMQPKHRAGGEPLQPRAGSSAIRFEGTMVHSDAGQHITHPAESNKGSHTDKERMHGGE